MSAGSFVLVGLMAFVLLVPALMVAILVSGVIRRPQAATVGTGDAPRPEPVRVAVQADAATVAAAA
jgi:hypothetical protein